MKPAKGIMPYAAKFVPYDDTGVTLHTERRTDLRSAKAMPSMCHDCAKVLPSLCHMLPCDAKMKKKLVKRQRHP